MPALDENFEIELRRPYAPAFLLVLLTLPMGLFFLLFEFPHRRGLTPLTMFFVEHPPLRIALALAILAIAAFTAWTIFSVARMARFAIVVTRDGVAVPSVVTGAAKLARWSAITDVRVNAGGDLVVRANARKLVVPRYWLRGKARTACTALDERLQHERRKLGAKLV